MKLLRSHFYFILTLCLSISSCNLPSGQNNEGSTPSDQSLAVTPTLAPVHLEGPSMAVGSTFQYVDGSTLIPVPAGPFIMGHGGIDNPQHTVNLSDFWIYRTKVTNEMYSLCVKLGKCSAPDPRDNLVFNDPYRSSDPVVGVTYDQAAAYCEFVHGRLPTEAEWEKTARGPEGNLYPWGDAAPSCDLLNFGQCVGHTTDVTTYPAGKSYYDALDMSGNAFEWVADWYDPTYYGASPVDDPQGPEAGAKRSVRSSAYNSDGSLTESARRFSEDPAKHRNDLGFRCVVEDPTYFAPWCEQVAVYGTGPKGNSLPTGTKSIKCNYPAISEVTYCGPGKQSKSNITIVPNITGVTVPSGVTVPGPPTCVGSGNFYTCNGGAVINMCSVCEVDLSNYHAFPGCPSGYTYDGSTGGCVVAQGTPGECLPGINYDPVTQCCAAGPEPDNITSLCPPGSYIYLSSGGPAHVQHLSRPLVCVTLQIQNPECEEFTTSDTGCPSGHHHGGGCSLTPSSCGGYFNAAKCCCTDSPYSDICLGP